MPEKIFQRSSVKRHPHIGGVLKVGVGFVRSSVGHGKRLALSAFGFCELDHSFIRSERL